MNKRIFLWSSVIASQRIHWFEIPSNQGYKNKCNTLIALTADLRILEDLVLFGTLLKEDFILSVPGPRQERLHQVLVVLKGPFWHKEEKEEAGPTDKKTRRTAQLFCKLKVSAFHH